MQFFFFFHEELLDIVITFTRCNICRQQWDDPWHIFRMKIRVKYLQVQLYNVQTIRTYYNHKSFNHLAIT